MTHISVMMPDRGFVTMDHLQETTHWVWGSRDQWHHLTQNGEKVKFAPLFTNNGSKC